MFIKRILLKAVLVLICVAVVSALVGIRIREYQRDYVFQSELILRLNEIESRQAQILDMLKVAPRPMAQAQPRAAQPPLQPPAEDLNKVYTIEMGESPVKGDPEAKVTVVEFSDIQCPFSQRFHAIFMQALDSYPQGVNYVFKNFPLHFHNEAKPAAKALWAAHAQDQYWSMLGLLMASGRELSQQKYLELVGQLNLDVNRFVKDLEANDGYYEVLIQKDMALGNSVDVRGTPTFFINGKKTTARTLEDIKKEIDALLR